MNCAHTHTHIVVQPTAHVAMFWWELALAVFVNNKCREGLRKTLGKDHLGV